MFINLLNLKQKPSKQVEDSIAENRLLYVMKNLYPLKRQVEQFLVFNIFVIITYFGIFGLKSLRCTVYTLGRF